MSETATEAGPAEAQGPGRGSSPERMRELTALSVAGRGARREALKALRGLPELVDVASAKIILAKLIDLGVAGKLSGITLGACVRATEAFLKAQDAEANRGELVEALGLLRELKARRNEG